MNDADRLSLDPAMRTIVDSRGLMRNAASTSEMGRFETEWLTSAGNFATLVDLPGAWIDRVHACRPPKLSILDMDSSESPTHGNQEGSAYNGHFGCTCYHPLFVFNQFGDVERCALRPGNVHSAHEWRGVLEPVVERYREQDLRRYFRGDAAFASPDIYEFLEAEGFLYAIRLPKNQALQESIAHLLRRPVGRPPNHVRRYYASFSYQAGTWDKARRVVAKVEWHPEELYPRVGFIVTNLNRRAERVVAFYNQRGTAEQHIKEGKNAINWTRLSCHGFRNNEVRLQLHVLACNIGNFLGTLALLDAKYHVLLPGGEDVGGAVDYYQWGALLRSVGAFRAYHKIYADVITPLRVAELLMLRRDLPRSLVACLEHITATLDVLCHDRARECQRVAGETHARLRFSRMDEIFEVGLHEFLTTFIDRNTNLGSRIQRDFMMVK